MKVRTEKLELPVEAVFVLIAQAAQMNRAIMPRNLGFEYSGATVGSNGVNWSASPGNDVVDGVRVPVVVLTQISNAHEAKNRRKNSIRVPVEQIASLVVELPIFMVDQGDGGQEPLLGLFGQTKPTRKRKK